MQKDVAKRQEWLIAEVTRHRPDMTIVARDWFGNFVSNGSAALSGGAPCP
ncbi:hypothetical protein [Cryobacterium psychrophilum]|nr:hypothetical protein [Cryobacterium psychrophilum]